MNTTVTIHLANILFHMDSDAYTILKNYLSKLEQSFANTEGKREILEDIEVRIAELFSKYTHIENYVISINNINDVIQTLGTPEDISEESPTQENQESYFQKKLYRDGEDEILGGIASGFSYYFGIGRIWIRLILVLLLFSSFGTILLIYIVFWAIIPKAETTSERLRMRGEPVNISNIEKKIKEGLDDVTQKVRDVDYSKVGNNIKKKSIKLSEVLEKIFKLLLKITVKVIGFFMVFISTILLIGILFSGVVFGFISTIKIPQEALILFMNTDLPLWSYSFLILFGIGIPCVFIFALGLRLLTSKRKLMNNSTKYTLGIIWITSLLLAAFTIAREFRSNVFTARNKSTKIIDIKTIDTLHVRMNELIYDDEILVFNSSVIVYNDADEINLLQEEVSLNISQSNDKILNLK